ncbi:MAG TPA: OB-fold nucleic acid binding domain-containing protein, partial [Candidatus Polarisedimenticolaceae bacterium]
PGPITGGMVHPYLRRRNGEEEVVYPHPSLEPVLKKTLGVPLFQEQVIRLAMVAADYTPGEADQLRRDMAAWRKTGRIERHRERLVRRMEAKGIEREFAERVFDQIRGFGEYGFPESHAASFSLIAYATAWMRRHHLDVFTCSLLNAQPMGFYSSSTIVEDAKRHGLTVLPVDVTRSAWDCTLEGGEIGTATIFRPSGRKMVAVPISPLPMRMGLRYVKGLREDVGKRVVASRPYASIPDLVSRAGLDEGSVSRLAEAGALRSLEPNRRGALWAAKGAARTGRGAMEVPVEETALPEFAALDAFETIGWDYRTSGHSAEGHPLEPLRERLRAHRLPDAAQVTAGADGSRARYAGLVICRQRPGTASGVVFLTLEDETGFVNVVCWAPVYERFRILVKTASFLGVTGKLQRQDGVVHLIADSFWEPRNLLAPATAKSRDFH